MPSNNGSGTVPSPVGLEWIVEAHGAEAARLVDTLVLRTLLDGIVDEAGLVVVGSPQWHTFGGHGGVTGLYLLSESHLALHTFPEYQAATINLYTCRPRWKLAWEPLLRERLGARRVSVREIQRNLRAGLEESDLEPILPSDRSTDALFPRGGEPFRQRAGRRK